MPTDISNGQRLPEKESTRPNEQVQFGSIVVNYAENEVPQPQPPVAFGFSKVNPEPIIFDV